jgi:hypothetical protein
MASAIALPGDVTESKARHCSLCYHSWSISFLLV